MTIEIAKKLFDFIMQQNDELKAQLVKHDDAAKLKGWRL